MSKPSTQLLDQLNALKADPEIYAGERGGLLDDTGVLALHEGFEELSEMLREAEDEDDIEEALKAWPVDLAIHMTYETVTPESAEHGEWADHGFYESGGWYYSIADEAFQERVEKDGRQKALDDMSPEPAKFSRLDEAVDYMSDKGALIHSSGARYGWYTTVEEANFDAEGTDVRFTFHVEGPTEAQRTIYKALWDAGLLLNYKPKWR